MPDSPPTEAPDNRPIRPKKKIKRRKKVAHPKLQKKVLDIPTTEDCLHKLSQLPGLIAMKAVTTAEANAMRGTYMAILQHLQKDQDDQRQLLPNESVLEIAQRSPQVLNLLEPLLTDEQIQLLMKNSDEDDDGEA